MAPLPAELRPSVPKTRSMESYVKSFITARSDAQQGDFPILVCCTPLC
jgi:hypothetical protein